MKNLRRMILIGFIIALGTEFSLSIFMEGFIITLSVILLPLLIYAYEPLPPMPTCLVTAVISPGFRMILLYLKSHNLWDTFRLVGPDSMFYVVYGTVYTLGYGAARNKSTTRLGVTVLAADFLSNLVEVSIRTQFVPMEMKVAKALLIIALVRTLIVMSGIMALKTYRSFLSKEEHEARYRRLMMLVSGFKSEIYFMHMNMQNIESIMGKSFRAYRLAETGESLEELRTLTLDISKDVHEIKKDYIRVVKGLEEISENRMELAPLGIRDMIKLLLVSLKESSVSGDLPAEVVPKVTCDVTVGEHFYLMSILRNLVSNALEACEPVPKARVDLAVACEGNTVVICCADNGSGIKPADLEYIFNPGFSTKYDPASGNMSRGLGLTLVRELVENHFEGKIAVESQWGTGTKFRIEIPKHRLEGAV